MKKVLVFAAVSLLSLNAYAQSSASIHAMGADGKVTFELDADNIARVSSDGEALPTIKDFREGSDFSDACYTGKGAPVKALLEALVSAADGDGDSFAELLSLNLRGGVYTVVVNVESEAGSNDETFTFPPCK